MQASTDYTKDSVKTYAQDKQWVDGPDQRSCNAFLDLIPSNIDDKVIVDLGCGGGELINKILAQRGRARRIMGIDISPSFLELAREGIPEGQQEIISFVEGDMDGEIPLPPSSVDIVISRFAVHYSKDLAALFRSIRTVLKPGGQFLFITNSFSGAGAIGKWIPIRLSPELVVHNFARSEEEYRSAMRLASLDVSHFQINDATYKVERTQLEEAETVGLRCYTTICVATLSE